MNNDLSVGMLSLYGAAATSMPQAARGLRPIRSVWFRRMSGHDCAVGHYRDGPDLDLHDLAIVRPRPSPTSVHGSTPMAAGRVGHLKAHQEAPNYMNVIPRVLPK